MKYFAVMIKIVISIVVFCLVPVFCYGKELSELNVCFTSNDYRVTINDVSQNITGVDFDYQSDWTRSIQFVVEVDYELTRKLELASTSSSSSQKIFFTVTDYSESTIISASNIERDRLSDVVSGKGKFKYFDKNTLDHNIISYQSPHKSSTWYLFDVSEIYHDIVKSWAGSCHYMTDARSATCSYWGITSNGYYLEIKLPGHLHLSAQSLFKYFDELLNESILMDTVKCIE